MEIVKEVANEQAVTDFSAHLKGVGVTTDSTTPAPAPAPVAPTIPVVEIESTTPVIKEDVPAAKVEAAPTEAVEATPVVETTPTPAPEKLDLSIEPTTPAPAATTEASPVNEYAKKYEELTKNPQAKFVLDWVESGKDIAELPSIFKTVDYSKLDAEALTHTLGQELKWTEDQLEAQKEHMGTLSPYQLDKLKSEMVNDLNAIQNGRLEQSTAELQKDRNRQMEIMQRAQTDIEQEATGMIGKEVHGVVMNKEDAEDFKKFVSEFNIQDANGFYNVKLLRNMWIGAKKLPLIRTETHKTATAEAIIKTTDEFTRPSVNGNAPTKVPLPTPKPAPHEQASKALEAFMKGQ